jgi:hypothetical protein
MLVFSLAYFDGKNSQQSYSFTGRTGIRFLQCSNTAKIRYRGTLPLGTAPGIAQKSLPDLQTRFTP